jgi:hypothetical protein
MGRRKEATDIWEEALQEAPDSELLKRVIERLSGTGTGSGTDS